MKILALDTSTEACSAALFNEGKVLSRFEVIPQKHAELILPMIDEILADSGIRPGQLNAIAFGKGPGAFTGIRIATGIAQGLAYSTGIPVIPVSSLAALAEPVNNCAEYIITAIDARMGEVYYGLFRSGTAPELITEELVLRPDEIRIEVAGTLYGTGSGWNTYEETLTKAAGTQLTGFDANRYPDAADILSIAIRNFNAGKILPPEEASPSYVRNKVTN